MTTITPDIASWSDQINRLIADNRRLQKKSDADDRTIHLLKEQYDALSGGVEAMVEDQRAIERKLTFERDRAERAYVEIDGHLQQAADLIMQAARARVGDLTPEKMPAAQMPFITDARLPQAGYRQ